MNGASDELINIVQAERFLDAGVVRLHRLHADAEPVGDLPGGRALAEQLEDLQFSIRQLFDFRAIHVRLAVKGTLEESLPDA